MEVACRDSIFHNAAKRGKSVLLDDRVSALNKTKKGLREGTEQPEGEMREMVHVFSMKKPQNARDMGHSSNNQNSLVTM